MQTASSRRTIIALAAASLLLPAAARAQPAGVDAIRARGKLLAGVKADTPPFGFVDAGNQLAGFDVDLCREIAKSLGVGIEFVKVTSPTRIPLLVSGGVDLVAASMTHTREREKTIDFSITYYTGAQSLLVADGAKIAGLKDLAGKTVAVQQGTTLEKNLASMAPDAKALVFRDYNSAWLALRQGRADALTGSADILRGFARTSPGFHLAGEKFSLEPFGIGIRHGDWALRDAVNAALQDIWDSGRYRELYHQWFEIDPDLPIETWPK